MPHIHLEYSDNIDTLEVKPMLLALNQALLDGQFVQSGNDIKSRAIRQSDFVIGVDGDAQAYLHAKVSLLSGRDEATSNHGNHLISNDMPILIIYKLKIININHNYTGF